LTAPNGSWERDVTTIRQRRGDSLRNGALWGVASGAAVSGTLLALIWESGDSGGEAAAFVAIYSGIGAVIGVGVDALIVRRQVIYERPVTGAAKLSVAPVFGARRQGVLVTMRF
jgi:hypothetical protein